MKYKKRKRFQRADFISTKKRITYKVLHFVLFSPCVLSVEKIKCKTNTRVQMLSKETAQLQTNISDPLETNLKFNTQTMHGPTNKKKIETSDMLDVNWDRKKWHTTDTHNREKKRDY